MGNMMIPCKISEFNGKPCKQTTMKPNVLRNEVPKFQLEAKSLGFGARNAAEAIRKQLGNLASN
jgi:hypothetical protein